MYNLYYYTYYIILHFNFLNIDYCKLLIGKYTIDQLMVRHWTISRCGQPMVSQSLKICHQIELFINENIIDQN